MSDFLCISVRWLDPRYHGRTDQGAAPEWPPSPLRLFQAMLSGCKRSRWTPDLAESFRWFEALCERTPPRVIAPPAVAGVPYTLFVPNNDTDKPNDVQRAAKIVRPSLLPESHAVRFVWPIDAAEHAAAQRIADAARHLTSLGWGIDLAIANGEVTSRVGGDPSDIVWQPSASNVAAGKVLRVPIRGSLERLEYVHEKLLARLADGINRPAPPFNTFAEVSYRRADALPHRPYRAFKLAGGAAVQPFEVTIVAARARHALIELVKSQPRFADLGPIVSGHGTRSSPDYRQFSYLPLPSIGFRHTDPGIRRVIIADAPGSTGESLQRLDDLLHGLALVDEKSKTATHHLQRIAAADGVLNRYCTESHHWASVTPVILPGHDDKKPGKTRKLIEKAIAQAGISTPCEFEWSPLSSFAKLPAAFKASYARPAHLRELTSVHLRLRFGRRETPDDPASRWIPADIAPAGPIALGAGRHCGFGVMAAVD